MKRYGPKYLDWIKQNSKTSETWTTTHTCQRQTQDVKKQGWLNEDHQYITVSYSNQLMTITESQIEYCKICIPVQIWIISKSKLQVFFIRYHMISQKLMKVTQQVKVIDKYIRIGWPEMHSITMHKENKDKNDWQRMRTYSRCKFNRWHQSRW
jgi:hypothetical protein